MKKFIYLFILLVGFSFIISCSKVSDEDLKKAREAVKNGALIVDVRTPKEFKQKHIPDAINLPIEKIMKGYINLPKNKEIVIYCRSGSRSSIGAKILREKGWSVIDVATQDEWERELSE